MRAGSGFNVSALGRGTNMSPTTSINDMSARLRSLVQAPKPEIKISFDSRKKTYTTLDRIEGVVVITAPVDTPFDSVHIEFVGTARTYVERLTAGAAATGRSEAFHQFLKLTQPDVEFYYPEGFLLKAGVAYEFPFEFAIPQHLLPRICQHSVNSPATRDYHLRLPPTFGDKDLAALQKSLDDGAPDMASVRYGIFAKVTEVKTKNGEAWRETISSKARRIRVIPVVETQPPLDVHAEDGDYVMRKEKTVRKGMLKGKAGTLIMEAAQPPALEIRSYDNPEARSNCLATMVLRYDPADENAALPKLGNLSSKLKITTYFASTARHSTPTRKASITDMTQGLHTEQFNLSTRCMTNAEWTKHESSQVLSPERRDSASSLSPVWSGGIPEPSQSYKGKAFYTARLIVPIQLPTNRAFVPTFHSCLISRVYALKFELDVATSGIGSSMELKIPVQISTEGLVGDEFERRASVASIDNEAEVDVEDIRGFFNSTYEPRVRVPMGGLRGRDRIGSQAPLFDEPPEVPDAPPGYSPFGTRAGTARMTNFQAVSPPVY